MTPLATAGGVDARQWQAHPEVWLLVAAVVALGVYVVRVLGPKVVPEGETIVTRRQKAFFAAGVVVLWLASDWPMHDLAEDYLFSLRVIQRMVLTLVLPPLFLLAMPTWLARLVLEAVGGVARVIRWLARPVPAAIIFNAVVALTYWPALVNLTATSDPVHYLLLLAVVVAAFLMWVPVCGPIPEWRLSPPVQMIYLFAMSILPIIPGGWLTFAQDPVYSVYDQPDRLFGLSVMADQQIAGWIAKLVGAMYLWSIIGYLFFTWASREESYSHVVRVSSATNDGDRPDGDDQIGPRGVAGGGEGTLTWDEAKAELDELPPFG